MGQLLEGAPAKAPHSSRNRARRMKAARAEARRSVGEALRQRDSALAELSAVRDELSDARRRHELECADLTRKIAEAAAQRDDAAEKAKGLAGVLSDRDSLAERNSLLSAESERLKQSHLEALDSLKGEREKSRSLLERLAELSGELDSERGEKEEFRQEVLGLRSKIENLSGLSNDEVNGLVARAQAADERSSELSQNMATLQNRVEDYERQLKEARDDYERLMRAAREELQKRKGELGEVYDLHEGELETNRELMEDNAALTDSIAKAKAELETVSAERDELQKRLADSARLSKELERVNMKLAEECSRADGADAALRDADGVKSLALPHGLLPGEETTVALGSGFQKFRVQKIVYRADGTICVENERGQSVPMGTWH